MAKAKRGEAWRNNAERFISADQLRLANAYPQHTPHLTKSRLFMYVTPNDRQPFAVFDKTPSGWVDGDVVFRSAMDAAQFAVEYVLPLVRRR